MAMAKQKNTTILIIGGHLTPALATLHELKARGYTNFLWVGHKYSQTSDKSLSAEYNSIADENIPFIHLQAGKLWRKWTLKTFTKASLNLLRIPLGFFKSTFIILKYQPTLIISYGGYLALPVVLAGKFLGKTVVTHEQTSTQGLANKLIARFADRIYLSWKNNSFQFPTQKTVITGNPIRQQVLEAEGLFHDFNNDLPTMLVTGGNQGANTINWRLLKILPNLLPKMNIIHQTGGSTLTKDYEKAQIAKQSLVENLSEHYRIEKYIFTEEWGKAMKQADFILSRSGANAITEALHFGKLTVLIPIPWSSNNEQQRNAELVASTGLALVIKQRDEMQPEEIETAILKALKNVKSGKDFKNRNLNAAQQEAQALLIPNATQKLVDELEKLLSN